MCECILPARLRIGQVLLAGCMGSSQSIAEIALFSPSQNNAPENGAHLERYLVSLLEGFAT